MAKLANGIINEGGRPDRSWLKEADHMRVGIWTFGLVLCLVGVALLWQNLTGEPVAVDLTAWWGAIPLLLGLELIVAHILAGRRGGTSTRIGLHAGSIVGLCVVLVVGLLVNAASGYWIWDFDWVHGTGLDYRHRASGHLSESPTVSEGVSTVSIRNLPGDLTVTGSSSFEARVDLDLEVRARTVERAEDRKSVV